MAPLARADTVSFVFDQNLGNIGPSLSIAKSGLSSLIDGFTGLGLATNLFEKNDGPTEFGIGLANVSDHEISHGEFVQVDISKLMSSKTITISFSFNSIQAGENYNVYGSNVEGQLGELLAANQTDPNFEIPDLGEFSFISIGQGSAGDVTLEDIEITRTPAPTPEGSTLLLFGTGLAFVVIARKVVKIA